MRGLLVRVGIDSACGAWNGPVRRTSGEFVYVPIPESQPQRSRFRTSYKDFLDPTSRLGDRLPARLRSLATHLDPDFAHLTYGDQGQRGARLAHLTRGDLLAFYAGLRSIEGDRSLVYALIGLYVVKEIVRVADVEPEHRGDNAHTRRAEADGADVVVRADAAASGRLERCIPIGEYRDRAYRVRRDLLAAWGDLDITDGYIQRSARLPAFRDALRFYQWFLGHRPHLLVANNP